MGYIPNPPLITRLMKKQNEKGGEKIAQRNNQKSPRYSRTLN